MVLELLKTMGCDYGQGYLYDEALPITDFEQKYMALQIEDDLKV